MNASPIHATPMQRVLTITDRTLVHAMSATVAMDLGVQVSVKVNDRYYRIIGQKPLEVV